MKKTLFLLVALVASMSINAQNAKVMKVLAGETVLFTQEVNSTIKVVFEEATTGTATRTGDVEVKWVQLWKNGPKFAEYNVGAENNKAEDYGDYYAWGGHQNMVDDHNTGTEVLSGEDDTATYLWGSNWRMPTKEELQALIDNCYVTWTDNYNGTNIEGRIFTGKGAFTSNSLFIPAGGACVNGRITAQGYGYCWSSTPREDSPDRAYMMNFTSTLNPRVSNQSRPIGCPVRAVLKE